MEILCSFYPENPSRFGAQVDVVADLDSPLFPTVSNLWSQTLSAARQNGRKPVEKISLTVSEVGAARDRSENLVVDRSGHSLNIRGSLGEKEISLHPLYKQTLIDACRHMDSVWSAMEPQPVVVSALPRTPSYFLLTPAATPAGDTSRRYKAVHVANERDARALIGFLKTLKDNGAELGWDASGNLTFFQEKPRICHQNSQKFSRLLTQTISRLINGSLQNSLPTSVR